MPCVRYFSKNIEGLAGAYAKDFGIRYATGQYVTFWDDDNYYFDNAINLDILEYYHIIVHQVYHLTPTQNYTIPRTDPARHGFAVGDIDTMCLTVRADIAKKVLWSDHKGKQTDYHWIKKVSAYPNVAIKYIQCVIGHKITSGG